MRNGRRETMPDTKQDTARPGPSPSASPPSISSRSGGILAAQGIQALHAAGAILPETPFAADQVQPASLDLRLGSRAFRVRTSFLPGSRPVSACIEAFALHEIDLTAGAVLETGCVYIAELQETLALPADVAASANPKSSTGRIDVFTRVITDRGQAFDQVEAGYQGRLYAEISPRTFPVRVRTGSRLSQIRFRRGEPRLSDAELAALHTVTPSGRFGQPVLPGWHRRLGGPRRIRRAHRLSRQAPYRPRRCGRAGPARHGGVLGAAGRRRLGRADPRSRPVLHPRLQGSGAGAAGFRRRNGAVRSAGG